jgi:GNAT superfamily N-acetyltransferase
MNQEGRASIRPAIATDVPALAELVGQYWRFEEIGGFSRQDVEALLAELIATPDLGAGWVATRGARLCGYLIAMYVFSLEHGGLMAEIDEVFVLPGERTAGIGGRLLDVAEAALEQQGCVRIQLQLGAGNEAARAFYHRRGYKERSGYELLDKPLGARAGGR